jgi:hypothetical protein
LNGFRCIYSKIQSEPRWSKPSGRLWRLQKQERSRRYWLPETGPMHVRSAVAGNADSRGLGFLTSLQSRPGSANQYQVRLFKSGVIGARCIRRWLPSAFGADRGDDYCYAFATYTEALAFSQSTKGAEAPLALIRQLEYIEEPNPGDYRHLKEVRVTEWPVEFLRRPRRTRNTIPDFLSPDAPANRLDILRRLANSE